MNRVLANDYRQGLTSIMGAVILVLSLFAAHIVIATSFALLAAGLAFFSWKSCYRRLRAIADTPSSRIASAAQGHVELIGTLRALPGFPLHGPLSGESCVWYRYWERRYTGIGWMRSAGETEAPFMMEDGSGACLVMPRGAEMTGLDPISRRKGNPRSPSKGDYEAMEWLLREGDEAHVVGRFSTLSGSSLDAFIDAQAAALFDALKAAPEGLEERFDLDGSGNLEAGEWKLVRSQTRRHVRRAFGDPRELHVIEKPADGRPFLLRRGEEGEASGSVSYRGWALFHVVVFLAALGSLPYALSKPWSL